MNSKFLHALVLWLAASILAGAPGLAQAQAFPTKAVRIVVPFPPGAGTDLIARVVGQHLSQTWGQPVVVDNRAGGGGLIATAVVAQAPADGYTLLIHGGSVVATAVLSPGTVDPLTDLTPIGLMGTAGLILEATSSLKATTVKELIDLAKSQPGQIAYGSSGTGTTQHIAMEMFANAAGIKMLHVPYKGGAAAQLDLVNGRIQLMLQPAAAALGAIAAKQARALAVTDPQRMPELPGVPTMIEAGVPGYEFVIWWGLLGPRGVPPSVVNSINSAMRKAIADPDVRKRLAAAGVQPQDASPEEVRRILLNDHDRFSKVIKESNIKLE